MVSLGVWLELFPGNALERPKTPGSASIFAELLLCRYELDAASPQAVSLRKRHRSLVP